MLGNFYRKDYREFNRFAYLKFSCSAFFTFFFQKKKFSCSDSESFTPSFLFTFLFMKWMGFLLDGQKDEHFLLFTIRLVLFPY